MRPERKRPPGHHKLLATDGFAPTCRLPVLFSIHQLSSTGFQTAVSNNDSRGRTVTVLCQHSFYCPIFDKFSYWSRAPSLSKLRYIVVTWRCLLYPSPLRCMPSLRLSPDFFPRRLAPNWRPRSAQPPHSYVRDCHNFPRNGIEPTVHLVLSGSGRVDILMRASARQRSCRCTHDINT